MVLCLGAWLAYAGALYASAQQSAVASRQELLAIQQRIEANDLDGARALLKDAQKKHPADAGLDNLQGVVEIGSGNAEAARSAFRAAIRHNPRLASAYMNLSRLEMQSAATDTTVRAEALRLSQRLLQLDPASDEARYQIASIHVWNKEYRPALEQLDRLDAEVRTQPQVQALVCVSQAYLGDRVATEQAAAALVANSGFTEQDAKVCLPGLRSARRADLIETLYTAVARRQSLTPQAQRMLGLAQEAEGKLKEARATLEAAFSAGGGKEVVLLVDLTRVAEAMGEHKEALGYLAHAREMAPKDSALPYEFGLICLRLGFFGEARKAVEAALRLAPESPEYNYGLGLVLSFSQDPSQGIPYLEKFRKLRPQDPTAALALGTTYFRTKEYEAAARWLHQAAESKQTAADAHYYLARIARQENRTGDAVAELKQSLDLVPDQADALAELGQIAVLTRDYAGAATNFNRALALEPDNYTANFGLLQLYARTGDERREQQSKRFDEIKGKNEERDRLMMRVIEIRPEGGAESTH